MNNFYHVVGLLGVSFLLAGCPSTATFKSANMFSTYKNVPTVVGTLNVPDGKGPFPAIVILHTAGGVSDNVNIDWPDYLNSLGYAALTVDTAGVRGGRRGNWHYGDQIQDAYGALDYLAGQKNIAGQRVALMGFSAGGNTINSYLDRDLKSPGGRKFKAAISVYGRCSLANFYAKPSMPIAMIIGDKEPASRLRDCQDHVGKTPIEISILKGAYHGFDNSRWTSMRDDRRGTPMLYDHKARKISEELVKDFLAKHLTK